MSGLSLGIFLRIVSNSSLNVFQKLLTRDGLPSSCVNFLTYFILSVISVMFVPFIEFSFSLQILYISLLIGIFGALGNYFIIKALSLGEISSLAPVNSYKPIVAMIIGILYLKEMPSFAGILGIVLIITGTYVLYQNKSNFNKYALFYRILALIFSGIEAVFIKKVISLTNVPESFVLWCIAGFIFSSLFILNGKRMALSKSNIKNLIFLVLAVGIMQFSTNYVFSKMNVAYALSIFQLSTLLSVYFGASVFNEDGIKRKVIASVIMITGAVIIILNS